MRARFRALTLGFVLLGATLAACATGTELDADDDESVGDGSAPTVPGKDAGRTTSSSGHASSSSSSSGGGASSSGSGEESSSSSSSTGGSSSSGSSSSSSGSGSSSGSPPACDPILVINEVKTGTAATGTDEFVEIYNKSTCALSFSGFSLVYRSNNDSSETTRFTGPVTVAAGAYLVIGGTSFTGTKQGTLSSGISDSGQLGIRRLDTDTILDGVAWGTVSGGSLTESAPAPAPGDGKSIARTPNGTDTNHNDADFAVVTAMTPGAAN